MSAMPVPASIARRRGFSLVELMVSIVIGLLALLFAVRLVAGSEKAQRIEVGSSDSMQNGMVALFSMSGDAAQAGFGLNDPILTGCDTVFSDTGSYSLAAAARGTASVHPLAPVIIESHGQDPDRVSFYAGSSMGGTGSVGVVNNYAGAASLDVDRVPYGFARGDTIVVAPLQAGGKCALAQLSADPTGGGSDGLQHLQFASGGDFRFNSGSLGAAFTASLARVFDLGPSDALAFHSWSVSDGFLQLSATDVAGSGATAASVADNIVSIKAQYGFDTRVGDAFQPGSGMLVGQWSSTMINADGDAVTGGAGDYGRIAAVRLAVVARSKAAEPPNASGVCTASSAQPVVFATSGSGAAAAPVTVNVTVTGDTRDWRCYRYRVFETIVPLRNFGWRPS
jgi:type IV pilus assembly protein PilW